MIFWQKWKKTVFCGLLLSVTCSQPIALGADVTTGAGISVKPKSAGDTLPSTSLSELIESYHSGSRDVPGMLAALRVILEKNPNNADAHFLAGEVYNGAGFRELSEQEFRQADKLDPSRHKAELQAFYQRMEENDYVGASTYLRYIKHHFPDDPAVLLMEGMSANAKREEKSAEDLFQQAMRSSKRYPGVATMLAEIRIRQHRFTDALALAKDDLSTNPRHFGANVAAGKALMQLGRSKEGMEFLRTAFNINPTQRQFGHLYAAYCYHIGLYSEAVSPELIYMAQTTERTELYVGEQELLRLMKLVPPAEFDRSVPEVAARLTQQPVQARLYLLLGVCLDGLQKTTRAIDAYNHGLKLDPSSAGAYFRLARDFERIGQHAQAQKSCEQCLAHKPADLRIVRFCEDFLNKSGAHKNDLAWQFKNWLRTLRS